MKTILEEWLDYKGKVLPANMSKTQHRETKRAFYAGATCLFSAISVLSKLSDSAEDQAKGLAILKALFEEITEFSRLTGKVEA